MGIPLHQAARIGAYLLRQHLVARERYPLVLMLAPLFRCNLACAACGKIDYPSEILDQRLSYDDCMARSTNAARPSSRLPAASRCCSRDAERSSRASCAQETRDPVHPTRSAGQKSTTTSRNPSFTWSIHLDGIARCTTVGVPAGHDDRRSKHRARQVEGLRVSINCTLFNDANAAEVANLPRRHESLGLDGITVCRRAMPMSVRPTRSNFLNRTKTKSCSRILARGRGRQAWPFSSLNFLNFSRR